MSELVSVYGDENNHGAGNLLSSNNPGKFFVNGKLLVIKDSAAVPDNAGHSLDDVRAFTGSSKFICLGLPVHRNNDLRYCGAQTIVTGQGKFYSG